MKEGGAVTTVISELKGLRRHVSTLAFCGLAALGANFGLDVWRRHDFERERTELRELLDGANDRLEAGSFVLDESGRVVGSLEERLAAIAAQAELLAHREEALLSSEASAGPEDPPVKDPPAKDLPLQPVEVLDAPLEELLWGLEALRADPFLLERYSGLLDPRTWKSEDIIADLEGAFGISLGPEERESARLTVGVYREATRTAYSRYQIALDASMARRALEADFDEPFPTGEFAEPPVPREEVLAVALVGRKRYLWEKARFPELHRKNVAYQYLPLAMLEHLRRFFSERSTR